MTKLLVWRDRLRVIYRDYEVLLRPLWKFVLSLIVLIFMNQTLGYDERLKNGIVLVVVSLISAFVPPAGFVLMMAMLALVHAYALASLLALPVLGVFLVLFLLFERYVSAYSYVIVLMPLAMFFHIPLLPALLLGLMAEPVGAVSSFCGMVVYFLFESFKNTAALGGGVTLDNVMNSYQGLMEEFLQNKAMPLYLAAVTVVVLIVYLIRRLAVPHAFLIAVLAGTVLFLTILLIGELALRVEGEPLLLLLGSLVSAGLAMLIQFIALPLDYSRIEQIEFSDDDYYYYVKAVPKMQVAAPKVRVKRINAQKITNNTADLYETLQQVSSEKKE